MQGMALYVSGTISVFGIGKYINTILAGCTPRLDSSVGNSHLFLHSLLANLSGDNLVSLSQHKEVPQYLIPPLYSLNTGY
jgi:hypothetical protein